MNSPSTDPPIPFGAGREDPSVSRKARVEVEETLLGCLLVDPLAHNRLVPGLDAHHFYLTSSQYIFAAMKETIAKSLNGRCGDMTTVHSILCDRRSGITQADLARLVEKVVSTANVVDYSRLVMEDWRVRSLERVAGVIQVKARARQDSGELIGELTNELLAIQRFQDSRWVDSDSIIDTMMEQALATQAGKGSTVIAPSGIEALDRLLGGGFFLGDLVFIAGLPGVGKSLIMCQAAETMTRHGFKVAVLSYEMSSSALIQRLATARIEICSNRLRSLSLGAAKMVEYQNSLRQIKEELNGRLFVNDSPGSRESVLADLRTMVLSQGIQYIILDHIHAIEGTSDTSVLDEWVKGIQSLIRETGVGFVCLGHVRQDATVSSSDCRPSPGAFLGSKSAYRAADWLIYVHREEIANPKAESRGVIDFILQKARYGAGPEANASMPRPTESALFDGENMRILTYKRLFTMG